MFASTAGIPPTSHLTSKAIKLISMLVIFLQSIIYFLKNIQSSCRSNHIEGFRYEILNSNIDTCSQENRAIQRFWIKLTLKSKTRIITMQISICNEQILVWWWSKNKWSQWIPGMFRYYDISNCYVYSVESYILTILIMPTTNYIKGFAVVDNEKKFLVMEIVDRDLQEIL